MTASILCKDYNADMMALETAPFWQRQNKSSRQINEPHVVLMLEKHHTFQSPLCARGLLIPNNPLKKLTNLLNLREDRAEGLDEIEESYCKNTRTSANLSL